MARIRTIKPEFWTSEQVVECSTTARLLFIGLWNFCDDAGRHPASYKRLKMEIFPGDACTDDELKGWMSELIDNGLLFEYEAQGESYWQVKGWHHQKIDKKTIKYPAPNSTNGSRTVVEQSSNGSRTVDDHSPPETNGTETNGKNRNVPDGGGAGVFLKMKTEDLKDTQKLYDWFKWQGTQESPAVPFSEDLFHKIVAAAEYALLKGNNPVALFASNIGKGRWGNGNETADKRATDRVRKFRKSQPRGDPAPETKALAASFGVNGGGEHDPT